MPKHSRLRYASATPSLDTAASSAKMLCTCKRKQHTSRTRTVRRREPRTGVSPMRRPGTADWFAYSPATAPRHTHSRASKRQLVPSRTPQRRDSRQRALPGRDPADPPRARAPSDADCSTVGDKAGSILSRMLALGRLLTGFQQPDFGSDRTCGSLLQPAMGIPGKTSWLKST